MAKHVGPGAELFDKDGKLKNPRKTFGLILEGAKGSDRM